MTADLALEGVESANRDVLKALREIGRAELLALAADFAYKERSFRKDGESAIADLFRTLAIAASDVERERATALSDLEAEFRVLGYRVEPDDLTQTISLPPGSHTLFANVDDFPGWDAPDEIDPREGTSD